MSLNIVPTDFTQQVFTILFIPLNDFLKFWHSTRVIVRLSFHLILELCLYGCCHPSFMYFLGVFQYYVHYVDYNKRLDEWVTEDRLDTRKIEPPTGKILVA